MIRYDTKIFDYDTIFSNTAQRYVYENVAKNKGNSARLSK